MSRQTDPWDQLAKRDRERTQRRLEIVRFALVFSFVLLIGLILAEAF